MKARTVEGVRLERRGETEWDQPIWVEPITGHAFSRRRGHPPRYCADKREFWYWGCTIFKPRTWPTTLKGAVLLWKGLRETRKS